MLATKRKKKVIKPGPQVIERYNYTECAAWVAHILGVEDLRDYAGRYTGEESNPLAPFQDFWAEVMRLNPETRNGSFVRIHSGMDWPDWARDIAGVFEVEFRRNTYWVEW